MGVLIDGEWRSETSWAERATGEFVRKTSSFREQITADGRSGWPAARGRYHLYVARSCPWCHRTMIFRALKQLQGVVSMSSVEPEMLEDGWTFREPDPLTGARRVYELYLRANARYTGRATVPVLWDKQRGTIVNNESSDILRMLNAQFNAFTPDRTDYYPAELAAQIDALNARIYETVNNGVYRAGFATRQEPYESAVRTLFATLADLESLLGTRRYLLGGRLTEADWRLFPTLVRFDAVYYGHFKCNLRHVYEHPNLWAYTRELYQMPEIAATVDIDAYKAHYYGSHRNINPTGIVPLGPLLDLGVPHGRGHL
ncbi:MAG TPA: glutathione S-transferase family protein [Steroidobacteraceae bacterium]|nr:glutathione S-transferase family protein [Steroidobacteraceae bacterium]